MAELRQRVFLLFVRPSYVTKSPTEGFPNIISKYIGDMYRPAFSNETADDYVKLPYLNTRLNTNEFNGYGGIERYYDDYGLGKMPDNTPTNQDIVTMDLTIQEKQNEIKSYQQLVNNNPSNLNYQLQLQTAQDELESLNRIKVLVANGTTNKYSTPPFNSHEWFSNDYWMLHSTWTSFDECKEYARQLIDLIGIESVLVSNYVELTTELLPNK